MSYETIAQEIAEDAPDDQAATHERLIEELRTLENEMDLPLEEAERIVRGNYDAEKSTSDPTGDSSDEQVALDDLGDDYEDEWITVQGEVIEIFELTENQQPYFAQAGLIGDDTGRAYFKISQNYAEENPDSLLEEGESYEIQSATGQGVYQGNAEFHINASTDVRTIDESFSPPENDVEIGGFLVNVEEGSGLIKRCPEENCANALNDGHCRDHGKVDDGVHDLRLKFNLDDGTQAHRVYMGREATEALTGITLDDAREIAREAHDHTAVMDEMEKRIIGYWFKIGGSDLGEYVVVDWFDREELSAEEWQEAGQNIINSIEV